MLIDLNRSRSIARRLNSMDVLPRRVLSRRAQL
jgi:hypothetical protein